MTTARTSLENFKVALENYKEDLAALEKYCTESEFEYNNETASRDSELELLAGL